MLQRRGWRTCPCGTVNRARLEGWDHSLWQYSIVCNELQKALAWELTCTVLSQLFAPKLKSVLCGVYFVRVLAYGFFFFLMDPTCNCHMMPRAGRASRLLRASEMVTGDGFALNGRIYEPGGDQWSMFNVVCNRTYLVLVTCARESLAYSSAQRCLFARFLCAQISTILNILCGDDD